ncbi:hypothetical protein ANANG_G00156800 [Anguilla anguilla]|uniref:Uncharacterized protein n=1 Tax=Anguilla anguilla TaxID=7936 RepID=A0A9D3M9I4_ANGAN|nr:hypothetical protein ANANG_G00156800 [Anguilla anguilla]
MPGLRFFGALVQQVPLPAKSVYQNEPSCHKAMKMHLFIMFCLLGVLTAQEVKELTSCQTKEKNLRMDCKYTVPDTSKALTCEYRQEGKVMGSTDPKATVDTPFKNRANVTLLGVNVCRLVLTGLSQDKPKNNTCIITQGKSANKTVAVDPKTLIPCSAISVLFQTSPAVLLTLLPVLLEMWHL